MREKRLIIKIRPGDLCSAHGAFAFKMKESCIKFDESMYDLPVKDLMDIMENTPDKINMLYIEFHYYQVGEDDSWLEAARKKSTDPISFRREFLLEWINTNGKSPFDPDDVDYILRIAEERKDNYYEITINKYFKLKVYSEYTGNKPVLISVDVAGGGGSDGSSVVVVNPETLKPMAFFSSNLITSYHLKRLLIALVQKIYPNSILTIERNYTGSAILDDLAESPIRRNLYKEKRVNKKDELHSGIAFKSGVSDIVYGHTVTSASRPKMMDMLTEMVQHNKEYLAFPELADEIKHLELKNGRIDHNSATHDDTIFAYFGALYIVKYGTGLKNTGIYFNVGLDEDDLAHASTGANLRLLDLAVSRNQLSETNIEKQFKEVNKFLGKEQVTMTGGEYLDNWEREQEERRLGYTGENSSGMNTSRLDSILSRNLNYSLDRMFEEDNKGKDRFNEGSLKSGWFEKYRGR